MRKFGQSPVDWLALVWAAASPVAVAYLAPDALQGWRWVVALTVGGLGGSYWFYLSAKQTAVNEADPSAPSWYRGGSTGQKVATPFLIGLIFGIIYGVIGWTVAIGSSLLGHWMFLAR